MAFFDKLNDFAKNLGDKTTDAIETGKLQSKVHTEKNAAGEQLKQIGQYYYDRFLAEGTAEPELQPLFETAKAHFDAAEAAQAEIVRIRAENEAEKAAAAPQPAVPAGPVCPGCGAANDPGTKFCRECGAKLEPAAPAAAFCPGCGAQVPAGNKFCPQCGQRMEQAQ